MHGDHLTAIFRMSLVTAALTAVYDLPYLIGFTVLFALVLPIGNWLTSSSESYPPVFDEYPICGQQGQDLEFFEPECSHYHGEC